jgi:phosphocarrier protein
VISRELPIINKLGLHARAAAKFVDTSSRFQSKITVTFKGKSVDAKSIMSVLLLAAAKGSVLEISAEGADEDAALDAMEQLLANRFGEPE